MTLWTSLAAGECITLDVPIGGYVLIAEGEVRLVARAIGSRSATGPTKEAVGGGPVQATATTEARIATGTIATHLAVMLDADAGYISELWKATGANHRQPPGHSEWRQRPGRTDRHEPE